MLLKCNAAWETDYAALINAADGIAPPEDTTPPTLVSTDPANGAADVAVGADIVMTFSEAVQAGTGDIMVYNAADDSLIATVPAADADYAGSTVTVDLEDNLAFNTEYYVEVAAGAIEDLAGNDFAGITDPGVIAFTTAEEGVEPPPDFIVQAVTEEENFDTDALRVEEGDAVKFEFAAPLEESGFVNISNFSAGDVIDTGFDLADATLLIEGVGTSKIDIAFGADVLSFQEIWIASIVGADEALVDGVNDAADLDAQIDLIGATYGEDWIMA